MNAGPDQGRSRRADYCLRCVSVCCTRNGRHVLAVTDTHARLNIKDPIDLVGLLVNHKIIKNSPTPAQFLRDYSLKLHLEPA